MIDQVEIRLSSSAELFAMAGLAAFFEESLQIIVESVRDRIAGDPTMNGWETGEYIPFEAAEAGIETESEGDDDKKKRKRRICPLNQPPVPLDWQVSKDIDDNVVDGYNDPLFDYRLKDYPMAM